MPSVSRVPVVALMVALFAGGMWFFASPLLFYLFLFVDSIERAGEPFGFIDRNGRVVNDLRQFNQAWYNHSSFSRFSEGLCGAVMPVLDDDSGVTRDRCVYLRPDGSFVANNATYYSAGDFSEGLAAVDVKKRSSSPRELADMRHYFDGDWIFIDKSGLKKCGSFGLVKNFSQGLAAVRPKDSLYWQFIDKNGITKITGLYSEVTSFAQNIAAVRVNDKWGLIDKSGKTILAPVYDQEIRPFHEGLAAVAVPEDNRIDYLNADGKIQFSLARHFPEPINFRSLECGESEVVSTKADAYPWRPVDLNYDVSEGLAVLEKDGKFGYADVSGRTIIAPRFDYCWPFVEGRARVFQKSFGKGYFGFIDHTGKEVIPCKYFVVHDFSEGFAVVAAHDADHSEYIDYSGRNVFGTTFPQAKSFHEGLAFVGRPPLHL